jgi:mono/diheme cytochrome c family protein
LEFLRAEKAIMRCPNWPRFGVVGLLVLGSVAACGDNETTAPLPASDVSFATVMASLESACSACHGAASDRLFKVTMDSASLVASGFIDPDAPDQSVLLLKARNQIPHGGGSVAGLSDVQLAAIKEWVSAQPGGSANVLTALKVTGAPAAPKIDGYASDPVWSVAPSKVFGISGGWADAREVIMKAAYDAEYLYVFVRYMDDKESVRRQPWIKLADGTWRTLAAKPTPEPGATWAQFMGAAFNEEADEYNYEDKFAIIWNTYGATTVAGFDQSGCAVLCHTPSLNYGPGTVYNYSDQNLASKKYTNEPGEIADMWHWKLLRTNQHTKLDDQLVKYWTQGGANPGNAGRGGDVGSEGYVTNAATNGRPTYRGPTMSSPPYYIMDAQKVALTQAEVDVLPTGAMIPNMITTGPTGTRADVDAKGIWNPADKTWTLEIRRKLNTGDVNDVQFTDLTQKYAFGVAVFDNAQIEHSWQGSVAKLVFKP